MRKIIIDCDPGHDDAIAIMLALAHKDKLRVELITTIGGNQTLSKVTKNALRILEFLGKNIPVASGVDRPLVRPLRVAPEAHGESGMDGPILPEPTKEALPNAIEEMVKVIKNSKEKITLVPIGPLTNIALLIKTHPEVIENIEMISFMGGGINVGNVTSAAEFNIYVDPEAADIVFNSGIPLVMSGLDVTNKAYILEEEYRKISSRGKVSNLVSELLDFYSIYGKMHGYIGNAMHDPCAIAYLIKPELFSSKDYYIKVILDSVECRGMTLADKRPKPEEESNIKVLLEVDREQFRDLLFDSLAILDEEVN
ncbi:MAG: nucleoside hydrolase [Clostridia bacterium]